MVIRNYDIHLVEQAVSKCEAAIKEIKENGSIDVGIKRKIEGILFSTFQVLNLIEKDEISDILVREIFKPYEGDQDFISNINKSLIAFGKRYNEVVYNADQRFQDLQKQILTLIKNYNELYTLYSKLRTKNLEDRDIFQEKLERYKRECKRGMDQFKNDLLQSEDPAMKFKIINYDKYLQDVGDYLEDQDEEKKKYFEGHEEHDDSFIASSIKKLADKSVETTKIQKEDICTDTQDLSHDLDEDQSINLATYKYQLERIESSLILLSSKLLGNSKLETLEEILEVFHEEIVPKLEGYSITTLVKYITNLTESQSINDAITKLHHFTANENVTKLFELFKNGNNKEEIFNSFLNLKEALNTRKIDIIFNKSYVTKDDALSDIDRLIQPNTSFIFLVSFLSLVLGLVLGAALVGSIIKKQNTQNNNKNNNKISKNR